MTEYSSSSLLSLLSLLAACCSGVGLVVAIVGFVGSGVVEWLLAVVFVRIGMVDAVVAVVVKRCCGVVVRAFWRVKQGRVVSWWRVAFGAFVAVVGGAVAGEQCYRCSCSCSFVVCWFVEQAVLFVCYC